MKGLGFWGVYGQYCWLDAPCKNSGWCFKSLGVLNASGLKKLRPESNSGCSPKKKMDALWCPPKSSWKTWRSAVKSYGTWENSSRCNSPSPSWRISVSWLVGHPMGNQWHSDSHVFRAGWGWWASPYNPIYKYTIHGKSKTWFTLIHQILPGFFPTKTQSQPTAWSNCLKMSSIRVEAA